MSSNYVSRQISGDDFLRYLCDSKPYLSPGAMRSLFVGGCTTCETWMDNTWTIRVQHANKEVSLHWVTCNSQGPFFELHTYIWIVRTHSAFKIARDFLEVVEHIQSGRAIQCELGILKGSSFVISSNSSDHRRVYSIDIKTHHGRKLFSIPTPRLIELCVTLQHICGNRSSPRDYEGCPHSDWFDNIPSPAKKASRTHNFDMPLRQEHFFLQPSYPRWHLPLLESRFPVFHHHPFAPESIRFHEIRP